MSKTESLAIVIVGIIDKPVEFGEYFEHLDETLCHCLMVHFPDFTPTGLFVSIDPEATSKAIKALPVGPKSRVQHYIPGRNPLKPSPKTPP